MTGTDTTTTDKNIRLFAQLGLEVTHAEARELANKVEKEIQTNNREPTFEDVEIWLNELRADLIRQPSPSPTALVPFPVSINYGRRRVRAQVQAALEQAQATTEIDPVTLEIIPETPVPGQPRTKPCASCGERYDSAKMVYYPIAGIGVGTCLRCAHDLTFTSMIGDKKAIGYTSRRNN
jgi:hypothetical protein